MKQTRVAALLPFRNESRFMETFMQNILPLVDVVLGYDDGSTDDSLSIFLSNGGILLPSIAGESLGKGATLSIREYLLAEGRSRGFDTFVVLDCDEILVENSAFNLRDAIEKLNPGEKMILKWVMASENGFGYLNENSIWSPKDKDFVFRDQSEMVYPSNARFVHFSRTPSVPNVEPRYVYVDFDDAFVLHLQFFNWEWGQIKQCWYRMNEVMQMKKSYIKVNSSYEFTKEVQLPEMVSRFDKNISPNLSTTRIFTWDIRDSWYFQDILSLMKVTPWYRFNNLDVWFLEAMKAAYREIYGREQHSSALVHVIERFRLRLLHIVYIIKSKGSLRKFRGHFE